MSDTLAPLLINNPPPPDVSFTRPQLKHGALVVALGPGQTINVWRPNTIKHCLVTKHANVEVSGQTVETSLIKHR